VQGKLKVKVEGEEESTNREGRGVESAARRGKWQRKGQKAQI
jgi:hypothetical protein